MTVFLSVNSCFADLPTKVEHLLLNASKEGIYKKPSNMELLKAKTLFRDMYFGKFRGLKKKWNELGFDLLEMKDEVESLYIIKEQENAKFGRGFYIFRKKPNPYTLQAPHSFFDYLTRKITLNLFFQGKFKAASWNTVSRKKADMADIKTSYMMAFSQSFAKENKNQYLIQIHGFRNAQRKTKQGRKAGAILSSGEGFPTLKVQHLARCMKNKVDDKTRVCFIDVFELCATNNVIAHRLKSLGHSGFIHMELSFKLRQALMNDSRLLLRLKDCLTE